MAVKITKGTEAINVEHPVFMIIGPPGIGKSSLAMSMRDSLLLDFDMGVHRAVNRRDSIQIPEWKIVEELLDDAALMGNYAAIVLDTVGRCLDKLAIDIMRKDAKLGRGGALSQQGWGMLKSRFSLFLERVKAQGKDIMLVSHDKEERDGDLRIARADIQGGSYGEVMKSADFVGYLYMSGKDRILDFSPTDRYVGKNPAAWPPMVVPPAGKATDFFTKLYAQGRQALGAITEGSAKTLLEVQAWTDKIAQVKDAAGANAIIQQLPGLSAILRPQVAQMIWNYSKSAGLIFDAGRKCYLDPVPATPVAPPEPAVPVTQTELPPASTPAPETAAEPSSASLFS